MDIIPRSESGLAPPLGTPTGPYAKQAIIIHYTASPNGLLSPSSERRLMRAWQLDHETKYGAWDALMAYSCFQSGRVYENRLWTSNSGAIYNSAGGITFGWSTHGVGIENQGDFHRSVLMDDTQYYALLGLCVDIYKRPAFRPLEGRFVFGHRELPPCRLQDPWGKGTDCPANLLAQFVNNNKLQSEILLAAKGQKQREEDEMDVDTSGVPVTERRYPCYIGKMQGGKNWDCWAKVLSLHPEPTRIVFKSITNSMIGPTEAGLSVTLQRNKSVEVMASTDLKMSGAGWIEVWAERPCDIGFDYRPRD